VCRQDLRRFSGSKFSSFGLQHFTVNLTKYLFVQFVFSSSATVYGQPEKVPVTEESTLYVLNPYGRTKVIIELVM